MKESEKAAAEAVEILLVEVWKLPAHVQNGTVSRLVDAIVRAAVARVAETAAKPTMPAQSPARPTLGMRK